MTAASTLAGVVGEAAIQPPAAAEGWERLGRRPEAVVSPSSADEAAALLRWASREGLRVVPAGGGGRLGPGTVDRPFVVLTTSRLIGMELYEPADLTFTAKAGTSMREIDSTLGSNGQWLPFDPPDVMDRTLGGLVSIGDSGPLATGYGALRNHVLGMTVVTGDGRTVRLGGRVVKNVAGFDLLKPVVGSRGGLCLVTSVCVRAFPAPAAERILVHEADTPAALAPLALSIGTAPVLPVSCVLTAADPGARARLVVKLHGAPATLDADQRSLEGHAKVRFEVLDRDPLADSLEVRELGTRAASGVTISVLPSQFEAALEAVGEALSGTVSADTYAARIRVEANDVDDDGLMTLRRRIESRGGAVRLEWVSPEVAPGLDLDRVESRRSPEEFELAARLARVFDPHGVFRRTAS